MTTKSTGFWMPRDLYLNKDLTITEKFMYVEIEKLSMLDMGCIASNAHFSELFDIKKTAVSRAINALKDKGYIKVVLSDRNHNRLITLNDLIIPVNKLLFDPLTNCEESKGNKASINKTLNKTSIPHVSSSSNYSTEFEEFWKLYQMKGNKKTAFAQWNKLDHNQMTMALNSLEYYFQESPEKQYRKDAERFIRDLIFESVMERADSGNLIIPRTSPHPTPQAPTSSPQDLFDHVDPNAPAEDWAATAKRMHAEREQARIAKDKEQNGGG